MNTKRRPCYGPILLATLLSVAMAHAADGVFARFKLVEPAGTNCFVQVGGNIHNDPWYLPNVVWPEGADHDATKRVPAGQFTGWFDVKAWGGKRLHKRLNRAGGIAEFPAMKLTFVTGRPGATGIMHRAVIELATAPDEKAVARQFDESFRGSFTMVLVSPDLEKDAAELESVWQMAARHLKWAREATGGKRTAPRDLVLQTGFWGTPVPDDAEAGWLLGFNVLSLPAGYAARSPELREPAGHHWVNFSPALSREAIDEQIRKPAEGAKATPLPSPFNFSDEICTPVLGTNPAALANFRAWLAEQKIAPQDLGVAQLGDVVPIETPVVLKERQKQDPKAANRVFYYTSRFRQVASTERLRWLTESFRKYTKATNALTSTLVADHPYFSGTGLGMGMNTPNMAWGNWPLALDWFDLARRQAVDVVGIEDWMGIQYMYGPNYSWEGPPMMGFQSAIMRSGGRGATPVIAWITPSNDTNFIMKITSALAQGAKHCYFWTYGPTCYGTENYWSDLRGAYFGVARYARQLAAAEHVIAPGVMRPTRVALLYSISSDLWQPFGYIHMLERRATFLALVHSQYGVDMLTEEDVLAGRLREYDALYVTDACVASAAAARITEWVEAGGCLYGACGAGSRNEFDEPVPGLAAVFGIAPAITTEVQPAEYRIRGNLNGLSYLDRVTVNLPDTTVTNATFGVLGVKVSVTCTSGRVVGQFSNGAPAVVFNPAGKGKAFYFATCPGLAYLKEAKFVRDALKEQYPALERSVIVAAAEVRGVPRLAELSHGAVETGIYDTPKGAALVLANFTYQPIEALQVRVPVAFKVKTVRSVEQGKLKFKREDLPAGTQGYRDRVVFSMPLGLNDIVLLE